MVLVRMARKGRKIAGPIREGRVVKECSTFTNDR